MRLASSPTALALVAFAAACGTAAKPAPAPSRPAEATPAATVTPAKAAETDAPSPAAASDPPPDAPATPAELADDTHAANAFTLRMLAKTRGEKKKNTMISGTSLRQAFGAVYVGAAGPTAKEIAAAFGFPADAKRAARAAETERESLEKAKGKGAELTVANKVWVDASMPLKPAYASLVAGAFGAPAENVDFAKTPDDARKKVNAWVSEETHEKIKELLPEGSVDTATRAVVTNAVYFKGKWFNPFPKDATRDEPFKLDAKSTAKVPTMHVTEQFGYAAVPGAKLVELRYVGNDLSLLVVLPDAEGGLAKIEESLSAEQLEKWTASLKTARLALAMPKLEFRAGGSVKGALQDLGVKTAFTQQADLSGMAMNPGDLMVSDVFHRTWIALDEVGTEAAAATGSVVKLTSLQTGTPTEVKVDRPFLFFVRGKDRILFAGRVIDPRAR